MAAEQLDPLAKDYGDCFATDMITVDHLAVGYMYREEPDFDSDSGWRFFAGAESQEYLNNADNTAIYDVNTIANYSPDIVPLLDAAVGTEFERDPDTGEFVEIEPE